jgi:hypothetical protein
LKRSVNPRIDFDGDDALEPTTVALLGTVRLGLAVGMRKKILPR